ncbi:unnamed protein product [Didymodactylos carnosus]|uniref:Uncharacterized protein n=1 Tax=Didymodactylos carnosus TaxID=1234261 RepID=A0A815WUG4_9BILA|nr:unnamed protein product [Didymodactylos carnosus]CAF1546276.1 unnamed protein product [Didymodactylos carnosus]CAF3736716.1 unnamed protein product [Didymodactylos carnosus]CAF4407103.1 unnamed protein product [Didymodactylos carnosus]
MSEHLNKDGNPDMRFKENRDADSDNNSSTRNRSSTDDDKPDTRNKSSREGSDNDGTDDGRSGIHHHPKHASNYAGDDTDRSGHHLTKEGNPDLRFKENRDEMEQEDSNESDKRGSDRRAK